MNWETIVDYFQKGESTNTAFLTQVETERDLGPTLVALANSPHGGMIFIGIDIVNYHLIGTSIDQKWVNALIQNFCSPIFNVRVESISRNDKEILCIRIPEGKHKPYKFLQKCYVRDQKNTKLASLDEEQLLSNQAIIHEVPDIHMIDEENPQLDFEPIIESLRQSDQKLEAEATQSELHAKLNHRQKNALDYLENHQSIQNKIYRTLFGVSHKTAHLELIQLVAEGYLISKGGGRNTCYIANPDFVKQTILNFEMAHLE